MKYAWIEQQSAHYPAARLCRVLSVSRSGYMQWRVRAPSERQRSNERLSAQLRVIYAENDRSYGRPRLWRALRDRGQRVGEERVRRLMLLEGIKPVYRRPYRITTDSEHSQPVAPNVLDRQFQSHKTNRAWVSDITYISTAEGWLYLAIVLDLASRRVVVGQCLSEWRRRLYVTPWRWPSFAGSPLPV